MLKKIFRSPITSIVLFMAAAGLLVVSSIGGVRAAINIQSGNYLAEIVLDEIDIALTENGEIVEGEDSLLNSLLAEGEELVPGRTYDEVLALQNNGDISEYVRVTVQKYWMVDGEKDQSLDPDLIDLHFVTGEGWTIDESMSTPERTVLYYDAGYLEQGAATSPFADTLTLDRQITDPAYADAVCCIEAVADGVQNHNAGSAITSIWGYNFLGITD